MNRTLRFFRESIRNVKTVGTVTRSSRFLCQRMLDFIDFSESKTVVELGAGDGVVTHHILKRMRPDAVLLSFETNKNFFKTLRSIDDPRLIAINDSAERLGQQLQDRGLSQADQMISAIPFVALSNQLGNEILHQAKTFLREGGLFVQINYSLMPKPLYRQTFGNVKVYWEPRNVPPAFVLVSKR